MATDYDTPRSNPEAPEEDSLNALRPARDLGQDSLLDEDIDTADPVELPGADLSGEVLQTQVLPPQVDEFICTRCFLVQHKNRLASNIAAQPICAECA
ncbi:DUF4193 domain-containing protein [Mycobacterium europaeum]|uniref:DUF4193 domain-containing protein n=1 Tax=Mycobacterium europaeum TaxID=761804 RepID=UPI000A150BBD|nr:DUF4193 domain-containing protein [Mycobacterium europaeum]